MAEKHGKVIIDTPAECRKAEMKLLQQSHKQSPKK